MATSRVRTDFLGGVVENGTGLGSTDNTLQSSALAVMKPVPDNERTISIITIDPFRRAGAAEICAVTSHASGAITATLARGQDNTLPRVHSNGIEWLQGPVVSDWEELNQGWSDTQAAVEEAVRRRDFSGKGQLVVGVGADAYLVLSVGPTGTVLTSRTASGFGVQWERLTWDSLSTALQDVLVPVGVIQAWAGAGSPPEGWLRFDGGQYSKLAHPRLDAVLAIGGYPWGQSGDQMSFILPNLNDPTAKRTLVGGNVGEMGGSATVPVSVTNMPPHSHPDTFAVDTAKVETDARTATEGEAVVFQPATYADLESAFGIAHVPEEAPQTELFAHTHGLSGAVGVTGGGAPIDVRNPYAAVTYIIKT